MNNKSMIRVNQAGECGAVHIYNGQLAMLRRGPARNAVEHMHHQEQHHLDLFNTLMIETQTSRTWLAPLWHLGGWTMGAVTALLGEKTAMACTDAVEEEINQHYQDQINTLRSEGLAEDDQLMRTVTKCHADELAHQHTAIDHGAHQAPGYEILTRTIRAITRMAIAVSKKI